MTENTPNENMKNSPEVPETPVTPQEALLKLQEHVEQGRFDALVDDLMGKAAEKKEVPAAQIDAFVTSLNAEQMSALENFLAGKPADTRASALRARLQQVTVAGSAPVISDRPAEGQETLSEPARKVNDALDKGIQRLFAGGKLNEFAAKIGIKEIGPDQLKFVKSFLLGYAAKLFEGVVLSIKKINPGTNVTSMLNLPLELRLLEIPKAEDRAKYKALYLERLGKGLEAPTLDEALNPQVAQSPVTQPASKPAEVAPTTVPVDNKITDAKRTIQLGDGTSFTLTRSNSKTIVTAAGNTVEAKVAGKEVEDVFANDANDKEKAVVTFKLVDRLIKVDADALQKAVQNKEKVLTTEDGTKIELLEIKNA